MAEASEGALLGSDVLTPRVARVLSGVLLVGLWLADALGFEHVAISTLYGLPLLICAWTGSRGFLGAVLSAVLAGQLVVGLLLHPQAFETAELVASCARLLIIACVVYLWIGTLNALGRDRISLTRQNDELGSVNVSLLQREEETVRQSEELQSQTEELERQSEELRVTNDELAQRERTLEQLLELSRGLTAELGTEAVHKRICEALGLIIEDSASAVLERRGDELAITCHHAFGPDGPSAPSIPYASSFSALVIAAGQTAYLDDLDLRADLVVPQPKTGARFRSVLATPMRAQGRIIGTLETYLPSAGRFTNTQVALVESLASQAAVSIHNAELFEGIRHERRRFESAFRTAPFGLLICDDPDGEELRLNHAAAAPFGLPAGEAITLRSPAGRRFSESLFRGGRALYEAELPHRRALTGAEVRSEEIEARLPDERTAIFLMSASPVYDGKGAITGAVCAFADITRQKELQRELELRRRQAEEADARKTRFLAAVSHDIRTPANAINLMAELIKRSVGVPALAEQLPGLSMRLQTNALSLVEFVSDVLDLARYDSGRVDVQESEFSLTDLIATEVEQLLPLAEQKELALRVVPWESAIWVRTDAVKVARILGNLVGNAIKFTTKGEVVVASGIGRAGEVWVRVTDSGPGIPSHELEHIFDEFHQLRNPERDSRKGTGLGLAICRRLVEVLGARIRVESEVGSGSSFTVTLPSSTLVARSDTLKPRPSAPVLDGGGIGGIHVLLVEDHEATRVGTAEILRAEGAHVAEAGDGDAALALLARNETEVLLLDMMLPSMDGREILRLLQKRRPSQLKAVLVLTGDMTSERRAEAERLGADGFLAKPIAVRRLLEILTTIRRTPSPPS